MREHLLDTQISDEAPIADALEQQRDAVESPLDEEASAQPNPETPLEVNEADWTDQLREVEDDEI